MDSGKKLVKKPNAHAKSFASLPFDQFSRQTIVKNIVENTIRSKNQKLSILDVGGYKGKTRDFFPSDNVHVLDVFNVEESESNYIKGDATHMTFEDNQYDIITSFDVLEHIPRKLRKAFISESNRVSRLAFFVAAPVDDAGGNVRNVEIKANELYKKVAQTDHPWLKEHIDYRLPTRLEIEGMLQDESLYFCSFDSNGLLNWLTVQSLLFTRTVLEDKEGFLGKNFYANIPVDVNEYYNEHVEAIEARTPFSSYRRVYFATTDKTLLRKVVNFKNQILRAANDEEYVQSTLELYAKVFDNYAQIVKQIKGEAQAQLEEQSQRNQELSTRARDLQQELDQIRNSKSWRITAPLRRANNLLDPRSRK